MSLSSSVPEPPTEEVNRTNPLLLSSLREVESQESLFSVSNASQLSYNGTLYYSTYRDLNQDISVPITYNMQVIRIPVLRLYALCRL